MYKQILIATDGSELATKAVLHRIALAKVHQASVSAVTVTGAWSAFDMAHDYSLGKSNPIDNYKSIAAAMAKKGSRWSE